MTRIHIIITDGQYTTEINGRKETAHRIESFRAFHTAAEADSVMRGRAMNDLPMVKEPERWGASVTSVYEADLI